MQLNSMQRFGRTGNWFCFFFVFCCLSNIAFSQTQAPVGEPQASPAATVQGAAQKTEAKPSDLVIDTKQKEIRLNCKLAAVEGILEFFLVDEKGRTYESIFKLVNGKPSELQFALLLLGFEPLPYPEFSELLKNPKALDVLKKKKCLVDIQVKSRDKQVPLTSLLKNREATGKNDLNWVFTGAPFDANNKFTADGSDVYISIWQEPYAIINLLANTGNPYRGNFGFEIAANHGFKADDEFTLIIKGVQAK